MVGLADDAFLFHPFHVGGGAVVADLQAALDVGGRGFAVAFNYGNSLLIEVAAFGQPHAGRVEHRAILVFFRIAGGDFLEIFRLALRLEVAHNLLDLVVRHEWTVYAADAPAPCHVQHVALAEQLLSALLAQDGAAVDLRRNLEGDASREVRLDGTGDDIDRRALRGEDHMDTGGARHLRQALDGTFDILAGDHTQVGHLVDDHHQVGQQLKLELLLLVDRFSSTLVIAGMNDAGETLAFRHRFGKPRVVAVDVPDPPLGHFLVTLSHP